MKSKYQIVSDVIENNQCCKISMVCGTKRRKILLDGQTANLLKKIFDKASPENKAKLESLRWDTLCNFAWNMCA